MLEFVHLTGSDAGKDIQTRKKVRSQAMRDFRRRQRAEREAGNDKPTKEHSGDGPVKGTTLVWQRREHSRSSTPSSVSKEKTRDRSRTNDSRSASHDHAGRETALPVQSVLHGDCTGKVTPGDTMPQTTQHLRALTEPDHVHINDFVLVETKPRLSRAPSTWSVETEDPFQSPAQIDQMLAFCKSYVHWLRPGTNTEHTGKVFAHAWESSQCLMLLAACCLASVGHLDAVQPNRPGGNYELYKARVLREISERMQSPVTATSDETIGALGLLTSFELSRGSGEALTHLYGLKSIINMKGGIDGLALNGLAMMLETLDLVHAVIFDSELVLTQDQEIRSWPVFTAAGSADADACPLMSPLLLAELDEFLQTPTSYRARLKHYRELLTSAAVCGRNVLIGAEIFDHLQTDDAAAEQFQKDLEIFKRRGCHEELGPDDSHHLARACYFQMAVFYNAVVTKTPYRDDQNQSHVEQLAAAVRRVRDSTWKDLPYLKLQILITGALATRDIGLKSFFKAQVTRSVYQMGAAQWRRVKNFFMVYIEMKNVLERSCRRSLSVMSEPVPAFKAAYLCPAWADPRRSSIGSSNINSEDMISNNTAHRFPYRNRASPAVKHGQTSTSSVSLQGDLSDKVHIDPFLLYTNSLHNQNNDGIGQPSQTPEENLASDRAFQEALFGGGVWLFN